MSFFRDQPKNGLQVEGSFFGGWAARLERSFAQAASDAAAAGKEMVWANQAGAPQASLVGAEKSAGVVYPAGLALSNGANAGPLDEATGNDTDNAAASAQSMHEAASPAEPGAPA